MDTPTHAFSYLSPSMPVSMGDWWFDVANPEHFWVQRRFNVMTRMADGLIRSCRRAGEIGCGNGLLQKAIEHHYGKPLTGFDLNELALQKNVSQTSPLFCYDIHQRDAEFREQFDLLILFDVLEHITEELEFLSSVRFHLAPSGILLVNVPAHQLLYSDYDRAAGHVRRYSIKQLTDVSEKAGFRVRAISYLGLPLLPLLVIRKAMKLNRENGRAGFDSRGPVLNFALSILARCELLPQQLVGTSIMAVLEKT